MQKQVIAAAVSVLALGIAGPAFAGWGCAFNSSAGIGRMWGLPSEQEARNVAMHACTSRNFKECRILGCSANVDSKDDADKIWALPPGVTNTPCGGEGRPKC